MRFCFFYFAVKSSKAKFKFNYTATYLLKTEGLYSLLRNGEI